jgi:phosphoribosylamine--glycine ligase
MEDDLLPWLLGAARGRLPEGEPRWKPGLGLCVVLAAEGYPGKVRAGDVIEGLGDDGDLSSSRPGVAVVHAGTKRQGGSFVTAGGRVLGVNATGSDLAAARAAAYGAIATIRWPGLHYRNDIGLRGRP